MGYDRRMFRVLIGSAALFLAVVSGTTVGADQRASGAAIGSRPAQITASRPHTGPLPPLPRVTYQPARPMAVVQQVYAFAAHHPEVLEYTPCFCGCERSGHKGNHDCFVKKRAANGRVTEWDEHGIGCAICLGVGHDAMTLFNGGAAPAQIRTAIDQKYAGHFPSSTPTPRPGR